MDERDKVEGVSGGRISAIQIERESVPPSDPPEAFDVSRGTYFRLSVGQIARLIALVALAVLSVAAVLPNVLPKKYTIATQTYVEEKVEAARQEGLVAMQENTKAIESTNATLGVIKAKIEIVEEARAGQEADRVTRHIRNGDQRVREYDRVYRAALRNLKAEPPRDPLDDVELP